MRDKYGQYANLLHAMLPAGLPASVTFQWEKTGSIVSIFFEFYSIFLGNFQFIDIIPVEFENIQVVIFKTY